MRSERNIVKIKRNKGKWEAKKEQKKGEIKTNFVLRNVLEGTE